MANSKTGSQTAKEKPLTKENLAAELEILYKQLEKIDQGAFKLEEVADALSTKLVKEKVVSEELKLWYNDIINDNKRKMYDLRNFHNFRSNYEPDSLIKSKNTSPNPNRSYYLSDICYSDCIIHNDDKQLNPDIQTIVLNEFQPNLTLNVGKVIAKISDNYLSGVKKLFKKDKNGNETVGSVLASAAAEVGSPLIRQKMIDAFSNNPSLLYGSSGSGFNGNSILGDQADTTAGKLLKGLFDSIKLDPMEQIRYMFQGGKWLNTYELPFFSNAFLETCRAGTWGQEGINQNLGDPDGMLATVVKGLKIDFPTAPIYNMPSVKEAGRNDIKFSFYLINKDEASLIRNFQFLSAFFSGTQWVSMVGGSIVSPNVYNVHVPGRFQIYWATLSVNITSEGRLTRLPNLVNSPVFKNISSVKSIISHSGKFIAGPLWPEAWHIDCTIKDLTMNNFNTFIDYYVDGWNQTQLATLEENHSLVGTLPSAWNAAAEAAAWLYNKSKEYLQAGIDWCVSTPASEMRDEVAKEAARREEKNRVTQKARNAVTEKIHELNVLYAQLDDEEIRQQREKAAANNKK